MIKVSVMYPNSKDVVFDKDYYCDKHVPLVAGLLGDTLKNAQVDFGIAGASADEAPMYVVMTHMTFDSIESFQEVFAKHSVEIFSDLPNFTNSKPQVQISEIKI
jgi:uncharacterized protein (TIGR02118 family)